MQTRLTPFGATLRLVPVLALGAALTACGDNASGPLDPFADPEPAVQSKEKGGSGTNGPGTVTTECDTQLNDDGSCGISGTAPPRITPECDPVFGCEAPGEKGGGGDSGDGTGPGGGGSPGDGPSEDRSGEWDGSGERFDCPLPGAGYGTSGYTQEHCDKIDAAIAHLKSHPNAQCRTFGANAEYYFNTGKSYFYWTSAPAGKYGAFSNGSLALAPRAFNVGQTANTIAHEEAHRLGWPDKWVGGVLQQPASDGRYADDWGKTCASATL